MFDPRAKKPAELEYILFGKGTELFLAHAIFAPPDFDHCLSVKLAGAELTEKDFAQDIRVVVPGRKNVAAERLREKQRVEATLRIGPAGSPAKVQLEAGAEFYFEEGELLVPPTFAPTSRREEEVNAMPLSFEIHPTIGIARLGASDGFFIGPEPDEPPPSSYRDAGGILRQAARFRIFRRRARRRRHDPHGR